MKTTSRRTPIHGFTDDGSPIVTIPLAGEGGNAVIDLADSYAFPGAGISTNWCFNSNGQGQSYVRVPTPTGLRCVARLITRAGAGEKVIYLDGDRRNLRRSNLQKTAGGRGKGKYAMLMVAADF